jgi:hypothetical protein
MKSQASIVDAWARSSQLTPQATDHAADATFADGPLESTRSWRQKCG